MRVSTTTFDLLFKVVDFKLGEQIGSGERLTNTV